MGISNVDESLLLHSVAHVVVQILQDAIVESTVLTHTHLEADHTKYFARVPAQNSKIYQDKLHSLK